MKEKIKLPPASMVFVGDGDFIKIGERFRDFLIHLAGLQKDHHILDVGCGIGRIAIPLTQYLSAEGVYWGFDIMDSGIQWCKDNITPEYPNFQFLRCDVYNKHYNETGKILAQNFRFPFENELFDVVFLTSVFTHMLPEDVLHYLAEISRCLKPGGKCLITFFILNDTSEQSIQNGESRIDFRHRYPEYMITDENDPEAAIAYRESFIHQSFMENGLKIGLPIHYGRWGRKDTCIAFQDIVVAEKGYSE